MLFDEDQRVPGFPEVAILSNEKVDGKFIGVVAAGDVWHSDQSYRRETSLATFLYAHKLPKQGGDTEFADMHGASFKTGFSNCCELECRLLQSSVRGRFTNGAHRSN
jgi:hypothetical protein